jgi:hypothetical protein
MSDEIFAAIDRFVRAHKRIRGLSSDPSSDLSNEGIIIAHEERTEALLQLLEWDTCDGIANAIRRLVRAQDRIQGLHDSGTYRDVSNEEFDRALADREAAILQLMEAGLQAEEWNRRRVYSGGLAIRRNAK